MSCGDDGSSSDSAPTDPVTVAANYSLNLTMSRIDQAGLDPFTVTATLKNNDVNLPGQTLTLSIPKGSFSSVTITMTEPIHLLLLQRLPVNTPSP